MAGLIDTSLVIEFERRGLPPNAILAIAPGEPVAMAAISASELLAGVLRAVPSARRQRRQAFVERVLDGIPILSFALSAARIHARLSIELRAAGQSIGANDLLIAATAIAHGYDVLTLNLRDFQRMPGLVVRQPDR